MFFTVTVLVAAYWLIVTVDFGLKAVTVAGMPRVTVCAQPCIGV